MRNSSEKKLINLVTKIKNLDTTTVNTQRKITEHTNNMNKTPTGKSELDPKPTNLHMGVCALGPINHEFVYGYS